MSRYSPDEVRSYTDHYFNNAKESCEKAAHCPRVMYQVFQRKHALLCGMKYVLKLFTGLTGIEVEALHDGAELEPFESVMHISGDVTALFELETIYLGLLARMTRVATNVRESVNAAGGKPVLFFPARFDVPEVQQYDGYAAMIGGAAGASTETQALAFTSRAVGTMPHALIAAFRGDTVAASLALAVARPNEPVWALVDFHNNSAREAVAVLQAFRSKGLQLAGVRLDTSQDVVDESIQHLPNSAELTGVRPELVHEVRRQLDAAGGKDVRIAVSGGFSAEKIASFEAANVPVDVYAVGERFLGGSIPFTSDIVGYYERATFVPCSKSGRELRPNTKLKRVI